MSSRSVSERRSLDWPEHADKLFNGRNKKRETGARHVPAASVGPAPSTPAVPVSATRPPRPEPGQQNAIAVVWHYANESPKQCKVWRGWVKGNKIMYDAEMHLESVLLSPSSPSWTLLRDDDDESEGATVSRPWPPTAKSIVCIGSIPLRDSRETPPIEEIRSLQKTKPKPKQNQTDPQPRIAAAPPNQRAPASTAEKEVPAPKAPMARPPKTIIRRPPSQAPVALPSTTTTPSTTHGAATSSPSSSSQAPAAPQTTTLMPPATDGAPTASPVQATPWHPPLLEPPGPPPPPALQQQHDADDDVADLEELMGWWTGDNFDKDILRAFLRHHGNLPPVVQMTGRDLKKILESPKNMFVPALARAGLVRTTHMEHLRMLSHLAEMPETLLDAPLTTAVVEFLTRRAIERKWKASTLLKYLCSAQGSLAMLPMYLRSPPVLLTQCSIWRQALRGATVRAKQELPKQPTPATYADVCKAIELEQSLPVRVAIIMSWMSCARCGCILLLNRSDIELHPDASLSIRFRKGKGARIRGPYTVHTTIVPPRFLSMVKSWLNQRKTTMFNMIKGPDIKVALRRVAAGLEQRSLRRGSLMTLSCTPNITDAMLMEFSGHTQQATLRRYLSWGTQASHLRTSMVEVAKTLTAPSIRFHHPSGTSIRRE